MEWATAIVANGRTVAASVIASTGEQPEVAVSALRSRGIPDATGWKRPTLRVRLSELTRCSADEYLNHFGIPSRGMESAHAVYRFTNGGRVAWVIPALVLIRALFKSPGFLLEQVFLPQSLELLALGARGPAASPRCLMAIRTQASDVKNNPVPTLNWLWRDGRAWAMASSVHQHAMSGRLDIDLPDIEVEIAVSGTTAGQTLFVTNASIRTVYLPSEVLGGEPVKLPLNGAAAAGVSVAGIQKKLQVRTGANGRVSTTDAEWAAIAVCLKSRRKSRLQGSKKKVFDGLLAKISGQIQKWRDLEQLGEVSWHLHENYYRRWVASGELQAMLDELNQMRSEEARIQE